MKETPKGTDEGGFLFPEEKTPVQALFSAEIPGDGAKEYSEVLQARKKQFRAIGKLLESVDKALAQTSGKYCAAGMFSTASEKQKVYRSMLSLNAFLNDCRNRSAELLFQMDFPKKKMTLLAMNFEARGESERAEKIREEQNRFCKMENDLKNFFNETLSTFFQRQEIACDYAHSGENLRMIQVFSLCEELRKNVNHLQSILGD